jgi:hypothetical protein
LYSKDPGKSVCSSYDTEFNLAVFVLNSALAVLFIQKVIKLPERMDGLMGLGVLTEQKATVVVEVLVKVNDEVDPGVIANHL